MNKKIVQMLSVTLVLILLSHRTRTFISNWKSIPLRGSVSLGYFYVQIDLGYPISKRQNLIYDTGSKMMIVPCKGCVKCNKNHDNGLFDPNNSATCQGIALNKVYLSWMGGMTSNRR